MADPGAGARPLDSGRMPSFKAEVRHDHEFVLVVASGAARLADLCGTVSLAVAIAHLQYSRLVCIDLSAIDTMPAEPNWAGLADYSARIGKQLDGMAFVVPSGQQVQPADDGGKVKLCTFVSLPAAFAWLNAARTQELASGTRTDLRTRA